MSTIESAAAFNVPSGKRMSRQTQCLTEGAGKIISTGKQISSQPAREEGRMTSSLRPTRSVGPFGSARRVLTVTAILTGLALLVQRLAASATRSISRLQDYLLPLLIIVPFCSGFLIMHPTLNPFSYQAVFLVHILSGNLILVLIPITKLSHVVIFPETQLISELAWHLPADAGSRVGKTLGKENLPI